MAINGLTINIQLPVFTGRESNTEQVRMLHEYLFKLTEQLNYILENLGAGNWNEKELNDLKASIKKQILEELNG